MRNIAYLFNFFKTSIVLLAAIQYLLLSGCASTKTEMQELDNSPFPRVKTTQHDGPPPLFNFSSIPDAEPKLEPLSTRGNRSPYEVWGKKYTVMSEEESLDYSDVGLASWYGTKFHGRTTSSGEIYDVYGMTAAHRSLPLPTYLEVTNLENNRSVVVKVNDRGPFHSERILDLSYAAAEKLGFAKKGVAKVKVSAIKPSAFVANKRRQASNQPIINKPDTSLARTNHPTSNNLQHPNSKKPYLQVGAFQDKKVAADVQRKIKPLVNAPVTVVASNNNKENQWHKVQIGPLQSVADISHLKEKLKPVSLNSPLIVYR